MNYTFFSVIIPTYNRPELLKDAIQSVIDQTFSDFELIIVDDHSTDNTKEVVDSFCDERIKYFLNDHAKGPGGARNAGLFRAKGEWVAFLDSDDMWLPKRLELLHEKTREIDNSVGLIYTGLTNYDFDNEQEISSVVPEKEGWIQRELLYKNYIGTFSVVTILTDLLKRVGGIDERFYCFEDCDLYVRIAGLSKVVFIKEPLTYVRTINKDRLSRVSDKWLHGHQLFWEKHREIINKDPQLRHRAASRVFATAVRQGNIVEISKAFPWTLMGLLFDLPNLVRTLRLVLSIIYKNKLLN